MSKEAWVTSAHGDSFGTGEEAGGLRGHSCQSAVSRASRAFRDNGTGMLWVTGAPAEGR